MYTVRFTRFAILGIQRYPDVIDTVTRFREGHFGEHKALSGCSKLLRTRTGNYRIIWTRIDENAILVVKVGDRKDVYRGRFSSVEQAIEEMEPEELSWADLGIEDTKVEDLPTYELLPQTSSLRQFFYGGYLYSPCLTEEQKQLLSSLNVSSSHEKIDSLLIQSSPGTGKTVCAALLACNLYEYYSNIILILPKNLCGDIQEYEQIKRIKKEYDNESFFVGTLEQWIESLDPELFSQIATIEEQKIALQQEAKRIHITDLAELHENDVKLYTSFIYAIDESVKNYQQRILYKQNREKIEQLSGIRKTRFQENLNNKILRVDALEQLSQKLTPETITPRNSTVLIIDEAQDYLLKELKLISNKMLSRWQKEHQHFTLLWLLGDMNQRIQPVDFDWGDLHLNRRYSLKYNYRNTRKILEFANICNEISNQIAKINSVAHPPPPSDPKSAFEVGEAIKILEVSAPDDVEKFLSKLSDKINKSTKDSERFLLNRLANQTYIIYIKDQEIPDRTNQLPSINYLSVAGAKGREFDGCVVLSLAQEQKGLSLVEANNWYTAATRPRQRLLVVMTSVEIEKIGRKKLQNCEFFDASDDHLDGLATWISQSSNAESAFENVDGVLNRIRNQVPDLYFDTYSVLNLIKASDEKIYGVESELISKLKKHDTNFLENQFREMEEVTDIEDRVGLRCLMLRALDRSWDAVAEASRIRALNRKQYHRILLAIADEMEAKRLPYEAARIRARVRSSHLQEQQYPFADEFPIDSDSPLVSILCKLAVDRIKLM